MAGKTGASACGMVGLIDVWFLCAFVTYALNTHCIGPGEVSGRILSTEDIAQNHEKFLPSWSLPSSLRDCQNKKSKGKETSELKI